MPRWPRRTARQLAEWAPGEGDLEHGVAADLHIIAAWLRPAVVSLPELAGVTGLDTGRILTGLDTAQVTGLLTVEGDPRQGTFVMTAAGSSRPAPWLGVDPGSDDDEEAFTYLQDLPDFPDGPGGAQVVYSAEPWPDPSFPVSGFGNVGIYLGLPKGLPPDADRWISATWGGPPPDPDRRDEFGMPPPTSLPVGDPPRTDLLSRGDGRLHIRRPSGDFAELPGFREYTSSATILGTLFGTLAIREDRSLLIRPDLTSLDLPVASGYPAMADASGTRVAIDVSKYSPRRPRHGLVVLDLTDLSVTEMPWDFKRDLSLIGWHNGAVYFAADTFTEERTLAWRPGREPVEQVDRCVRIDDRSGLRLRDGPGGTDVVRADGTTWTLMDEYDVDVVPGGRFVFGLTRVRQDRMDAPFRLRRWDFASTEVVVQEFLLPSQLGVNAFHRHGPRFDNLVWEDPDHFLVGADHRGAARVSILSGQVEVVRMPDEVNDPQFARPAMMG
ncbi:hypothetical protein GIS00_23790 [Nakamurella sp. YIM 132087]|uniref:Uncharacterized protein n=1 Tax=Nakamurella alba TaxID=2665158 RepID=A0A7K1FS40_9ACTN|nr:hypothetical protein [Nakamurella alba]MTD16962.1 hypothetical protein [Nakamurella alba]